MEAIAYIVIHERVAALWHGYWLAFGPVGVVDSPPVRPQEAHLPVDVVEADPCVGGDGSPCDGQVC